MSTQDKTPTTQTSPEEEELAAEALASSGGWHDGPPPGKAKAFWPSFKRMIGLLTAHRNWMAAILVATAASVALAVIAPKVLGRATNVVFEGVVSQALPAGTTKEQAIEALRAQGMDDFATMLSAMDITPGTGIDFQRLGGSSSSSWACTRAPPSSTGSRGTCSTGSPPALSTACGAGSSRRSTACP